MTRYILKSVLWNADGYRRPAGHRATGGYPEETGYGHEEWNNSPSMAFSEKGMRYRAFHTERVGGLTPNDEAVVLMCASHDNVQQLVGIAGQAKYLANDEDVDERQRLVAKLGLNRLSSEAWAVDLVKTKHAGDKRSFMTGWKTNLHWIPNWRCAEETYLWLDEPVPLDAKKLRGTKKLLSMFSQHTELTAVEAAAFMDCVPEAGRVPSWHRIRSMLAHVGISNLQADLKTLERRRDLPATTRQRLVDARLGQGKYRAQLERRWNDTCAVSGCGVRQVLRASHIMAWKLSNDQQRLDPANGLLLTADLDALFDQGLISFADDGEMLLSGRLAKPERSGLRLPRPLRRPLEADEKAYMAHHREKFGFVGG